MTWVTNVALVAVLEYPHPNCLPMPHPVLGSVRRTHDVTAEDSPGLRRSIVKVGHPTGVGHGDESRGNARPKARNGFADMVAYTWKPPSVTVHQRASCSPTTRLNGAFP